MLNDTYQKALVILNQWGNSFVRNWSMYEGVSKSFRTGRLERELKMLQLSATRFSFIAVL
jgi:hypothetical protein